MKPAEVTQTFLFSEIVDGPRLWETFPDAMPEVVARYQACLKAAVEACGGVVFKSGPENGYATFETARQAVEAAVSCQRNFGLSEGSEVVPVAIRMAIHTGAVEARDGDYFGRPLNRVARMLALAHGGQILVSSVTTALLRDDLPETIRLRDLGSYRLRDLQQPDRLSQVDHTDLKTEFPPLSSGTVPSNLPRQLTRFLGREREVEEIHRLIGTGRLLTLTGAGGTGKTRLAIEIAGQVQEDFTNGVWLIELAPVGDPRLIAEEVARTFSVREVPGVSALEGVVKALADWRALLIFDNCEHVLDAAAEVVSEILQRCPEVRIVTTSREPLNLAGEQTYRVPSLSLPDGEGTARPETLVAYDSVQLFLDRATTAQPSFLLTPANASAVAQVCRELDGIPLALELAAARVRAMPVEKVAERLSDRFRLLTGGSRTALPRQQTLRALIDWSYDLLNERERSLLRSLSLFVGGWNLEASQAIAPAIDPDLDEWEVLDLTQSLVEKSLVMVVEEGRYNLLETVRRYALDKLTERGEIEKGRKAHADWFEQMAAEASRSLQGPEQAEATERLGRDEDNLRSALDTYLEERDAEKAQRLAGALAPYWDRRGFLAEGFERCTATLSLEGSQEGTRLRALLGAATLAYLRTDYPTAESEFRNALELAQTLGDGESEGDAMHGLGNVRYSEWKYEASEGFFRSALELRERRGDRVKTAASLHSLGNVALRYQNFAEAHAYYSRALAIRREFGDLRGIALTGGALSQLALAQDAYDEAERLTREAVTQFARLGIRWAVAIAFSSLIVVAEHRGDGARAARMAGARARLREVTHFQIPPIEREGERARLDSIRDRLGHAAYDAAFSEGYALSWDHAVALALT